MLLPRWVPELRSRLGLGVAIVVSVSFAIAVVLVLAAGVSAEPTCTNTWTGATEGTWQTATNWSLGHVPTSSEVACIGSGKTVKATEGTNQAGVVEGEGTLLVTGGTFEVASTTESGVIHSFTLQNATLTGSGTVKVSSSFTFSQATMSGSGSTVVQSGGAATINNGNTITARSLVNEGTTTLVKENAATVTLSEGAQIKNAGTFNANAESGSQQIKAGTGTSSIVNSGTFQKAEGTGITNVAVSVENTGTVKSQTGELRFEGGGSSTGAWSASEGAVVALNTASYSLNGGSLSGSIGFSFGAKVTETGVNATSASLTVYVSTLTVQTGTITLKNFTLNGSTLTGGGTLAASASLTLAGNSSVMSGSGSTVVPPGATGTINGTNNLTQRTLVNEGTTTLVRSEAGTITMSEGAQLKNSGTFKANAESGAIQIKAGTGASSIVNTGTFEKTDGTGTTEVEPNFENLGVIRVETGTLKILHPVSTEPSTQYGGSNPSAPTHPCPVCGEPVAVATGNLSETQTDLSIGGLGVGLNLVRTYNSQAAAASTKGAFGFGWSSSFSDHLTVEEASKKATLVQANGSTVAFGEGSGGSFTPPAWTQDTLSGTKESGYVLTLANQTKYKFTGATGRLESVTDRNGNATTLSYTGGGLLEAITDPTGRKISLTYNGESLVESAKDPAGHVVKYTYESGQLASVTEAGEVGARWSFKYDASHQLTEMTDGRSGKTLNQYNGAHQVTLQTDPLKRELSFEYAAFSTKITNKATGSVTEYLFTSTDEPYSITRGVGTAAATSETFAYNAAGYLTGVTDGNKHTTTYGYDAENNRTSAVDANNNETKWTYNATHDVETITNPKGERTTIKRDVHGNPEVIERPAPGAKTQTTRYKYDTHGNVESITDPLEHVWKYEYNAHGDRTTEIDPEGDKRTWGYDEDSYETSAVSPRGHVKEGEEAKYTTNIERDARERPIKVTDPLGHETKYAYDGNGNLETVTDPNAHATTYTYDADNERTKVKEANGTVTETGYDGAGQVTSQTDGNKHTTKYTRNAIEQVTELEDPLKHKTTKEYDAAGNLKTVTDPAKRTTTYKYDAAGRLTEISYSDGKTHLVQYEYDADNNRTKMVDGTGTTTYSYDQLDRLAETEDGHKDVTKYEHDLANQKTKITYPNGKAITRAYDKAGRLEKVTDWLEHATSFKYDPDSDVTATIFPSSTTNEDKYTFNEADQLTNTEAKKGATTLASLSYTRDNAGQLKTTKQTGLPGGAETSYTYDENERLTAAGTVTYKYDLADNPTKTGASTNTFNAGNELEKGTGVTYSYDELGQRTKRTPTTGPATIYGYDQTGSLTTAERPKEGEVAEIKDSYGYNGDGLRMSQTISGTTNYLAWDVAETIPLLLNDGANSYVYGPDALPVEQINGEGKALYLHHDQQGSTRLLTGSAGAKEGAYTFGAYGNQTGYTGTATTPLGYDAEYVNADTGLIYLRARAYDPSTAQFVRPDPLQETTDEAYTYASDNPSNLQDPTGLCVPTLITPCPVQDFAHEAEGFLEGVVSGATGGLIGGSNKSCPLAGEIGFWGALLLPEGWGAKVLGTIGKISPRAAELIIKVQTNKRVTEPSNVKIVIATVEKIKHLF
jgi:RHS repeat-associated protein